MTTIAAIRQATARDAFAVAALHLQWGREAQITPTPGFLDRWADAWLADRENRPFWLAEIDNRPLGAAGLHVVETLPVPGAEAGRLAIGSFLYVTPTFRRCGLAGRLVRDVSSWTVAHGIDRVLADLAPLGPAGAGIARRLGSTAETGLVEARPRRVAAVG